MGRLHALALAFTFLACNTRGAKLQDGGTLAAESIPPNPSPILTQPGTFNCHKLELS